MDLTKTKPTWIQCVKCGHLFQTEQPVSIEELYVISICPKCGGRTGLNCGTERDDIYLYMDQGLDERYFDYSK